MIASASRPDGGQGLNRQPRPARQAGTSQRKRWAVPADLAGSLNVLMMTPRTLAFLRSSTAPRVKIKRKVTAELRARLIARTVTILRRAEPTAFALEGTLRHSIRSGLCLRSWGWGEADAVAADVVGTALAQIGAKRPTWKQGQPEYTQEGVIMIERTRCLRCGWRLPDECHKFCERRCAKAFHEDLYRRFRAEEVGAFTDEP